jgi:hypothetical protein
MDGMTLSLLSLEWIIGEDETVATEETGKDNVAEEGQEYEYEQEYEHEHE